MNRILFFALIMSFGISSVVALTPEKEAEYKKRFGEGVALVEQQGKTEEARKIFEEIIKEEPTARGSLFFAALLSLRMGEADKASGYLASFRKLEPKDFRGLILSIQAEQALKRQDQAEALRKELLALRKSSFIIGLSDLAAYPRERVKGANKTLILINEFFDYTTSPGIVWEAVQIEDNGKSVKQFYQSDLPSAPLRSIVLLYNPDLTEKKRRENPSSKSIECFELCEFIQKDGKVPQTNIYRRENIKPDYIIVRKWFLDALQQPPKSIDTINW